MKSWEPRSSRSAIVLLNAIHERYGGDHLTLNRAVIIQKKKVIITDDI